jgi:hypothetical protein
MLTIINPLAQGAIRVYLSNDGGTEFIPFASPAFAVGNKTWSATPRGFGFAFQRSAHAPDWKQPNKEQER